MENETQSTSNATDKYVAFEENIRKFFVACDNIKKVVQSRKVISKKNMIYDSYDQFVDTYEQIGAEDTMIIFEKFYMEKRFQILSRKDTWIGNNSKAVIEFPSKKKTRRRKAIFLSIFYHNAKDLSAEAEKEVTEYNREEEADNVYLPEEMIYPLLEIFALVAPAEDMDKLNIYREEIKAELPSTDISPNKANPMSGMGDLGSMLNGALGSLDLSNLQKSFGGKEGESSNGIPEGMDFGEAINGIFNNPESKNIINKVTGKFKGMKNMGDIQSVVGDLLSDKELQDSFKSILPEAVSDSEVKRMVAEAKEKHPDIVNPECSQALIEDLINTDVPVSSSSNSVSTTMISDADYLKNSGTTTTSILQFEVPEQASVLPSTSEVQTVPLASSNTLNTSSTADVTETTGTTE
tara:strand:+ start:320 stop:1543 length:1224 start_codon:yes stop_codon:yes gene_type:complete